MENKEITVVSADELSLVENNSLNEYQLSHLLKKTPAKYIKERPGKGGGKWKYVSGGYIKKCLNLMFGWDWDFEIVSHEVLIDAKEVIVKGRLTCRTGGRTIVKMQFGNKDIMFRKGVDGKPSNIPLSVGNDMKAAATDCLKKCAAEIGIAADIYNPEEFREVQIESNEVDIDTLKQLFEMKREFIPEDEIVDLQRIIEKEEKNSFSKALKYLQSL